MLHLLEKLFVKDKSKRQSYVMLSGVLGIINNTLLFILKLIIGLIINSISVISDGLNNLSDMMSSLVEIISSKFSSKKADEDHPYGHGNFEYIATLIVAFIIILMGFELIENAIESLIAGINGNSSSLQFSWITFILLTVSLLVKLWMFIYNKFYGKKINSPLLVATSKDSLSDILTTFIILISLILGTYVIPDHYFIVDSIISSLIGIIIIINGITSVKDASEILLGHGISKKEINEIESLILKNNQVLGVHDLTMHTYGDKKYAVAHVEMDSKLALTSAHEIADTIEKEVKNNLNVDLVIHIDPVDVSSKLINNVNKYLKEVLSLIDKDISFHDVQLINDNIEFDVVFPYAYSLDNINHTLNMVRGYLKSKGINNLVVINVDNQ